LPHPAAPPKSAPAATIRLTSATSPLTAASCRFIAMSPHSWDTSLLPACAAPPPTQMWRQRPVVKSREGRSHGRTPVHGERPPCVHPPTAPPPPHAWPILGSILSHRRREDRAPPCDLPTAYITSRASIGECASPYAEPNNRHLQAVGAQRASVPRVWSASLLHQHRRMQGASFTLQR
jgi:hypothetical protein